MSLLPGQAAPWFTAPTASNPEFVFDSAAGRYVLMLFLPEGAEARLTALRALQVHQRIFDDALASAFVVYRDAAFGAGFRDMRGLRWIDDTSGALARTYGSDPHWLLLDPMLRVIAREPIEAADALFARIGGLPAPGYDGGRPGLAPVLTVPRVFEPELCDALIARHQAEGGDFTGVMRDAGDRTVAVMDDLKKRRDIWIGEGDLQDRLRARLETALFPMVERALGFAVTRIERYLVSCYDAADGGVFRPHRDNTTQGTAHRRFACSLNLNDSFEGGDLRFPEFGPTTYRAPVGGAVVFACGMMHEALPVTAGRRYAFLPFFYDEAGQATLDAYRSRLAAMEPAT